MLVHYYKTKFEVSGEVAPLFFEQVYIEFKMTVNRLLATSIGLISVKPCQIGRSSAKDGAIFFAGGVRDGLVLLGGKALCSRVFLLGVPGRSRPCSDMSSFAVIADHAERIACVHQISRYSRVSI